MIFGDTARFAIELERGDYLGGIWLYGRFNYWIAGERLGDEREEILGDILIMLTYPRGDSGKRCSERLFHLPLMAAAGAIEAGLQAATEDKWDHTVFGNTFPGSYVISAATAGMMGWRVYLIDWDNQSRLIWQSSESNDPAQMSPKQTTIRELILRQGEVDAVIESAAAQLEAFCAEVEGRSGT